MTQEIQTESSTEDQPLPTPLRENFIVGYPSDYRWMDGVPMRLDELIVANERTEIKQSE